MLSELFGFGKKKGLKPPQKRDPKRYEAEKEIACSTDAGARLTLAGSDKTHREILYYLAENDPDPGVRKAVALNHSTPVQASPVLAKDTDTDVRVALVERLVNLLPELSTDDHSHLYAFVVQALGTLALDKVLKVRVALAETLKDHAHAPPKVAAQLARDVERQVSEPILRFCAALTDQDLIDILKNHPQSWAVQAIAGRQNVSEGVAGAVIETEDVPGGRVLIENEGAVMTASLLKEIVERAKKCPEWHRPIALRKSLSSDIAKQLASFVDESVRALLAQRKDFDKETIEEISNVVRRRIDYAEEGGKGGESPVKRARRLKKEGRLDETTVSDALAMRDREFVIAALAVLCGAKVADIARVCEMPKPKPITAVAWRAGLSMRLAFQLQKELVRVPHPELIYPKDGTDYPLSEDDMKWQLDFLDIGGGG